MNSTRWTLPVNPAYWRLQRRQLIRRVRLWEHQPVRQRQGQVLVAFFGLLLLGAFSINANRSSQPPELLRQPYPHATQATNVQRTSTYSRQQTHEHQRPDSTQLRRSANGLRNLGQ